MKKSLFILLFIPLISFSQTYRNPNPQPIKIEVSQKTKTSADHYSDMQKSISNSFSKLSANYAANASASRAAAAQTEKNRIESLKYSDIRQKNQAIEIALNPLKAFNYGTDNAYKMTKKEAKSVGFSEGTVMYHKIPNSALFTRQKFWEYRNESENGVVTELELKAPRHLFGMTAFLKQTKKERLLEYRKWQPYFYSTEKWVKSEVKSITETGGDEGGQITHKVDINKAKVWGNEGFSWSWFYEDDYEFVIKENFRYISPQGVVFEAGVRYRGDKDEVTFEMLLERRGYLKRLCAQIIATARVDLGKKGLNF